MEFVSLKNTANAASPKKGTLLSKATLINQILFLRLQKCPFVIQIYKGVLKQSQKGTNLIVLRLSL